MIPSALGHVSRRTALLAGLAVGALLAAGATTAIALIPDGGGVIHGCYLKAVGTLRVVSASSDCTKLEVPIQWNQTGPAGLKGDTGAAGAQGPKGDAGETGPQGATGPAGPKGDTGATGAPGDIGPAGPQGPKGDNGQSAYELAVAGGFDGSQSDWLTSLKGNTGTQGPKGDTGATGAQGPKGDPGPTGPPGESAFPDVAVFFANDTLTAQTFKNVTAWCPAGWQALSGGYQIGGDYFDVQILQSVPDNHENALGPMPTGWTVYAHAGLTSLANVTVQVVCALTHNNP